MHLNANQWSAVGTIVSAIAAIANLIVLLSFIKNNKATLKVLTAQAKASDAQAAAAVESLQEMRHERKITSKVAMIRDFHRFLDIQYELHSLELRVSRKPVAEWHPLLNLENWPSILATIGFSHPQINEQLADYGLLIQLTNHRLSYAMSCDDNDELQEAQQDLMAKIGKAIEQGRLIRGSLHQFYSSDASAEPK